MQAAGGGFRISESFAKAFAVENQNQAAEGLHTFPNYDAILFKETPGADGEITQYVRIRTLWPYVAGLNHTTESQINCVIDYVRADSAGRCCIREPASSMRCRHPSADTTA